MPSVRKSGTVDDIVPSLKELRSIQYVKTLALKLIGGDKNYPRDIVDRLRAQEADLHTLNKEWLQVRYYKRSKTLSVLLSTFEKDFIFEALNRRPPGYLGRSLENILKIWGNQFDSPGQLFLTLQEAIRLSNNESVKLIDLGLEHDWIFKGFHYSTEGPYSDEQFRLLILEEFDRERRYFEKLKQKHDFAGKEVSSQARPRIPERIRIEVWRRDGGKCARCGSREKLEYDHIVPLSKGGSNTARNIELLCEECNRKKSNNIQ